MTNTKHTPEDLNYSRWPGVDESLIDPKKIDRYRHMKAAIMEWCDGFKLSEICKKYEISRSGLSYLLSRCTRIHSDGFPWGFRALIKDCRQAAYTRKKDSTVLAHSDGYGLAEAFEELVLRYPAILKIIKKEVSRFKVGINVKDLLLKITKYLRDEEKLTAKEYPFNTKSCGYVSLCTFINKLIANGDCDLAEARFGKECRDGLQRYSGEVPILRPLAPLEIACYDEQMLPFIATLVIEIDGKEIDVPMRRGYLCVLMDQRTVDILGYSIAIAQRFRALDLLNAYETFVTPWKPRVLSVPNMKYAPGSGLPSGVVPEAQGRRISIISVDNHLSHLANSIVSHLRIRTGAIIRYGKVKHWISRYAVEGIFSELQKMGFSRIPSTTGSGINDPAVNDPVGKSVKHRVRMEQMIELIDVLIANHNALPRMTQMTKTPNEALAMELGETRRISVVPKFPASFINDPQLAVEILPVTVRGSQQKGVPPYVQLDKCRYTNDLLKQHWSMIGKRLVVHIKGDYRKIRAFKEDGAEYGVLGATGHWSNEFHTRETRKEIIRLQKEKILKLDDFCPVTSYSDHLGKQAIRNSHKKINKITNEAGELANSLADRPEPVYRHRLDEKTKEYELEIKSRNRRSFFNSNS